jgi:hypothetical protein
MGFKVVAFCIFHVIPNPSDMTNYEPTLVETLEDLRRQGYSEDFNIRFDSLICARACLLPSQFEVDKVYRFEGNTNPSDEAILYAISSISGDIKGVLINSYGVYADEMTEELINKLN